MSEHHQTRLRNKGIYFGTGFFMCLICVAFLFLQTSYAYTVSSPEPQTVRVGYMLVDNFQEGEEGEIKSGYGYEYLQMIRNYTGWNYEYVYGTWAEILEMLEQGEIDLISHVARTPERDETLLFSMEPQGRETHYLYIHRDNSEISSSDYSTLNGKTIGSIQGDFRKSHFEAWCREQNIQCKIIEYSDMKQMHQDLSNGTLDAVSESRVAISGYKGDWKEVIRFDDTTVYFAVNKDRPDLLEQINKAQTQILSINEFYGEELQKKYQMQYTSTILHLTPDQRKLLNDYGVIRVGYCDERRPLAYTDDETGELKGLLSDYLTAMTKAYGMQFETQSYDNGVDLLKALLEGDVDVISPVGYTPGMAERGGVSVSNPITIEAMLAIYKSYKNTEPNDIFHRIAVLNNSITEKDYAKRFYPDAELVQADSIGDAIKMVEDGRADCYMMRSSTWSWYKENYPLLKNLQVLNLPDSNDVNMAIRTSDFELLAVLNKGISLIDENQIHQAIITYSDTSKELTLFSLVQENPWTTALITTSAVLAVILLFVIYRLRTESIYSHKLKEAMDEAEMARLEAERARVAAERANLAKSTFLTSMSHDIRTPMNAIIGMTTLASKNLNNPEYISNCLRKVTLASNHLLALINDVLDINKIETGKLALNPTIFSLADSMMNLSNISRPQISEKKQHFEIRIHNVKQEYVFADELRINQIFINLLSNAVKYTPIGGHITVDVKQESIPDDFGKVRVTYMVQDTGIGMSKEFQKHMYELFAMANRNKTMVNGSGVGLAICKQLVDMMEGTILCESTPNAGTTFTVILDLPVADKLGETYILPAMKLLLVDDDEVFLTTASETLRDLGLSPDCASSGEEAVQIVTVKHFQNKDYPVIIIDWKMPGMDGFETTKAIRALVGDDVSIIVISAYDQDEVKDAALAAGANGFISKPFFQSRVYQDMSRILGLQSETGHNHKNPYEKYKGMHVLVAEDNDLNWEIIHEILKLYGITSVRAVNGKECLSILDANEPGRERSFDLVFMDIQMPFMNGYEAAAAIRSHENEFIKTIPIIAMTADAFTEDIMHCIEVGMNAHISKPVDVDQLFKTIQDLRDEIARRDSYGGHE